MHIYISHSTSFDYQTQLYTPLRAAFAAAHELILPHELGRDEHSRQAIASSDLMLAEVSYPSTGQGVELGWADAAGVPIICFYKNGATPSGALRHIAKAMLEYTDEDDMIQKLATHLA